MYNNFYFLGGEMWKIMFLQLSCGSPEEKPIVTSFLDKQILWYKNSVLVFVQGVWTARIGKGKCQIPRGCGVKCSAIGAICLLACPPTKKIPLHEKGKLGYVVAPTVYDP